MTICGVLILWRIAQAAARSSSSRSSVWSANNDVCRISIGRYTQYLFNINLCDSLILAMMNSFGGSTNGPTGFERPGASGASTGFRRNAEVIEKWYYGKSNFQLTIVSAVCCDLPAVRLLV